MAEYTVRVAGFTEREGDAFTRRPAKTIGALIVEPPIELGEMFTAAVLGREAYRVGVHDVIHTQTSSVLVAEAAGEEPKKKIEEIAKRVAALANSPESVTDMMNENPFPEPYRGLE